eukprot:2542914-Prymnesium_polylepis.1
MLGGGAGGTGGAGGAGGDTGGAGGEGGSQQLRDHRSGTSQVCGCLMQSHDDTGSPTASSARVRQPPGARVGVKSGGGGEGGNAH